MAMPAIETGVFKFPPELSAEIIINGLLNRSEDSPEIHLVRICVGAQEMKAVFASTFAAKISSPAQTSPWGTAPSDPSLLGAPGTSRPGWLRQSWVTGKPGAGCGSQKMS